MAAPTSLRIGLNEGGEHSLGRRGAGQIPLSSFSLSLDSDQKDQLIEVIEKLLADKTTVCTRAHRDGWCEEAMERPFGPCVDPLLPLPASQLVAGSVVMAFEEVCPERIDLIHKNYRKLCNLLIDVEEWGQVVIISMLTRYARTQFLSPTQNVSALGPRPSPAARGGRVTACLPEGVPAGGEPREGLLWLGGR